MLKNVNPEAETKHIVLGSPTETPLLNETRQLFNAASIMGAPITIEDVGERLRRARYALTLGVSPMHKQTMVENEAIDPHHKPK